MGDDKKPKTLTPTMKALASTYGKYTDSRSKTWGLRDEVDDLIVKARAEGVTFRQITALTGRSIAWVQGAVERAAKKEAS